MFAREGRLTTWSISWLTLLKVKLLAFHQHKESPTVTVQRHGRPGHIKASTAQPLAASVRKQSMSPDHEGLKITLFGNFGMGNLGNDATLQAMLSNLRRYVPKTKTACVCTGPEGTELAYNILAFPTRVGIRKMFSVLQKNTCAMRKFRASTFGLPRENWQFKSLVWLKRAVLSVLEPYQWVKGFRALWGTNALIIPGTGLLTDASGLLYWGPYDMFRWSVIAKLCRCKLFFVSVGAGPIYSRAGRFFVRAALSLADFRSYRDESTLRYLKSIGFRATNDRVFPDLVFSLPERVMPRGRESKGHRLVVGLGLMEYAGKYSIERPSNTIYSSYLEALVGFVSWLLVHEFDIRLLIGDRADNRVTREFRSLLKQRSVGHEQERIIDEPVTSVEDLLKELASTELVLATRFHNVLSALLLNKPVIAISFHHKCASLMSQMGLSEYCQDINSLSADRLITQFSQLQQNADCIKRMISERVEACRDALEEQYTIIFREICREKQQWPAPANEISTHH